MDGELRLRTYRKVWQVERVIYQIERVRLPFPVSFRQIGVFTAAVLAMALVSRIPPLGSVAPVVRYVLLPGFAAWYLTKQTFDGRAPHLWLRSVVRFWLSPKRLRRLEPLLLGKRERFRSFVRVPHQAEGR